MKEETRKKGGKGKKQNGTMEEEENVEGAKGIRRRKGDKKEKRGER